MSEAEAKVVPIGPAAKEPTDKESEAVGRHAAKCIAAAKEWLREKARDEAHTMGKAQDVQFGIFCILMGDTERMRAGFKALMDALRPSTPPTPAEPSSEPASPVERDASSPSC